MDHFDIIYNFDLDSRACALTNQISADQKKGFYLRQGHAMPLDEDAYNAYLLTVFLGSQTDLSADTTPVQDLFLLAGLEYQLEKPHLDAPRTNSVILCEDEIAVGLFAGLSADHPQPDPWPEEHWLDLTRRLLNTGIVPLLLGSQRDDAVNRRFIRKTDAAYPGPLDWHELRATMNLCEVVVAVDHAAIALAGALGKQVIAIQNSPRETITRDIFRGNADICRPDSPGVSAGLDMVFPDAVFQAVIARISDHPEPPVKNTLKETEDLTDLINLITSRSQTAQTRVSP